MSLWVDKYRPNSLTKLDYHKTQALHLKNLVCIDLYKISVHECNAYVVMYVLQFNSQSAC
jgi:hypothetical protein